MRALVTLAPALALAACASPATDVLLTLRDDGLPAEVASLRLDVCGADGDIVDGRDAIIAGDAAEVTLPIRQRIAPLSGDASRLWGVRVTLEDASGNLLTELHRAGQFTDGERDEHLIALEPACIGIYDCPIGESCRGGTCEPLVLAPLATDDARLATYTRCGGEAVPPCEGVADGDACPGGTCFGGECCRGCIDAATSSCVAGDAADACGSGGSACMACTECAGDVCDAGACRSLRHVRTVSAGVLHTCAVTTDDALYCWGTNDWGALGFGSYMDPEPVPRRIEGAWSDISVHLSVTCALTRAATPDAVEVWCWGANWSLQLGYSTDSGAGRLVPGPTTAGPGSWAAAEVGMAFVCALDGLGRLLCWGQGDDGGRTDGIPTGANALGTGENASTPTPVPGSWRQIATGGEHGCAISSLGGLSCWGDNEFGQVGNGGMSRAESVLAPLELPTPGPWASVAAGGQHTCAIDSEARLHCWGRANNGRVGAGPVNSVPTPTQVNTDEDWAQVSPGGYHTCALRLDGSLWCFGANSWGQSGQDTGDDVLIPTRVGARTDWTLVDAGGDHTCAVTEGGALYCFGGNTLLQLGVPAITTSVHTPTRVCID